MPRKKKAEPIGEKFTIGVDVDGVLRDFTGSLTRLYKYHYPDHEVLPITEWGLEKFFPIGKDIYKFAFEDHYGQIMLLAEARVDMVNAVNSLHRLGYRIHIITSQPKGKEGVTIDWLREHGVSYDAVTFTSLKSDVLCDAYIDDGEHNINDLVRARKKSLIYLMDQPWNQHMTPKGGHGMPRKWGRVYRGQEFANGIIGTTMIKKNPKLKGYK